MCPAPPLPNRVSPPRPTRRVNAKRAPRRVAPPKLGITRFRASPTEIAAKSRPTCHAWRLSPTSARAISPPVELKGVRTPRLTRPERDPIVPEGGRSPLRAEPPRLPADIRGRNPAGPDVRRLCRAKLQRASFDCCPIAPTPLEPIICPVASNRRATRRGIAEVGERT